MKKICFLLVITLMFVCVSPAFALIRTRNVEVDDYGTGESKFAYKVAYQFPTSDVTKSATSINLPIDGTITNQYYYGMPFKGTIVGVSITSNADLSAGSVTADVTVNGTVTGVRTSLDAGCNTREYRSGIVVDHSQYNAQTISYDDTSPPDWGGGFHDSNHQYGKATPLEVGDQLGVQLSTSVDLAAQTAEMVITVIVLQ